MRFKKLVSASAALALSATAFAGLGTQALASTLKTFDFDTTSLSASTTGNKTNFSVEEAGSYADSINGNTLSALAENSSNKVLILGCSSRNSSSYLGYQADLGENIYRCS